MSDPVKITIPPSVAVYVKPGVSVEDRMRGAGGDTSLQPRDLLLLLFCLSKDADHQVRELAVASFASMSKEVVLDAVDGWSPVHPAILHMVAQHHGSNQAIRRLLLDNSNMAEATVNMLNAIPIVPEEESLTQEQLPDSADEAGEDIIEEELLPGASDDEEQPEEEEEAVDEEEFLSKYKLSQVMGIGEKIKMALSGDKEWRKILVKDSNKLVSSGVLKNPRITDAEVLTILKAGVQNDEIIRLICANREWVKNYTIRKALIENPKTPLANALRYLGTVNEKDLSNYSKSRNISSVIVTQAKRMLLNKKR
jgi:hypothetical protein